MEYLKYIPRLICLIAATQTAFVVVPLVLWDFITFKYGFGHGVTLIHTITYFVAAVVPCVVVVLLSDFILKRVDA